MEKEDISPLPPIVVAKTQKRPSFPQKLAQLGDSSLLSKERIKTAIEELEKESRGQQQQQHHLHTNTQNNSLNKPSLHTPEYQEINFSPPTSQSTPNTPTGSRLSPTPWTTSRSPVTEPPKQAQPSLDLPKIPLEPKQKNPSKPPRFLSSQNSLSVIPPVNEDPNLSPIPVGFSGSGSKSTSIETPTSSISASNSSGSVCYSCPPPPLSTPTASGSSVGSVSHVNKSPPQVVVNSPPPSKRYSSNGERSGSIDEECSSVCNTCPDKELLQAEPFVMEEARVNSMEGLPEFEKSNLQWAAKQACLTLGLTLDYHMSEKSLEKHENDQILNNLTEGLNLVLKFLSDFAEKHELQRHATRLSQLLNQVLLFRSVEASLNKEELIHLHSAIAKAEEAVWWFTELLEMKLESKATHRPSLFLRRTLTKDRSFSPNLRKKSVQVVNDATASVNLELSEEQLDNIGQSSQEEEGGERAGLAEKKESEEEEEEEEVVIELEQVEPTKRATLIQQQFAEVPEKFEEELQLAKPRQYSRSRLQDLIPIFENNCWLCLFTFAQRLFLFESPSKLLSYLLGQSLDLALTDLSPRYTPSPPHTPPSLPGTPDHTPISLHQLHSSPSAPYPISTSLPSPHPIPITSGATNVEYYKHWEDLFRACYLGELARSDVKKVAAEVFEITQKTFDQYEGLRQIDDLRGLALAEAEELTSEGHHLCNRLLRFLLLLAFRAVQRYSESRASEPNPAPSSAPHEDLGDKPPLQQVHASLAHSSTASTNPSSRRRKRRSTTAPPVKPDPSLLVKGATAWSSDESLFQKEKSQSQNQSQNQSQSQSQPNTQENSSKSKWLSRMNTPPPHLNRRTLIQELTSLSDQLLLEYANFKEGLMETTGYLSSLCEAVEGASLNEVVFKEHVTEIEGLTDEAIEEFTARFNDKLTELTTYVPFRSTRKLHAKYGSKELLASHAKKVLSEIKPWAMEWIKVYSLSLCQREVFGRTRGEIFDKLQESKEKIIIGFKTLLENAIPEPVINFGMLLDDVEFEIDVYRKQEGFKLKKELKTVFDRTQKIFNRRKKEKSQSHLGYECYDGEPQEKEKERASFFADMREFGEDEDILKEKTKKEKKIKDKEKEKERQSRLDEKDRIKIDRAIKRWEKG